MAFLEPRSPSVLCIIVKGEVLLVMHGLYEIPKAVCGLFEPPTLPGFAMHLPHKWQDFIVLSLASGVQGQLVRSRQDQGFSLDSAGTEMPQLMRLSMRCPRKGSIAGIKLQSGIERKSGSPRNEKIWSCLLLTSLKNSASVPDLDIIYSDGDKW